MPKLWIRSVCLVAFACSLAFAQQIATVSSTQSFQLRGADVVVGGVPSWPVIAGDEIATRTSEAVITFQDGSKVTLAAGSRAKVKMAGGRATLRLLDGSGTYSLPSASTLRVYAGDRAVAAAAGSEGGFSMRGEAPRPNRGASSNRDKDKHDDDDGLPPMSKHKKDKK